VRHLPSIVVASLFAACGLCASPRVATAGDVVVTVADAGVRLIRGVSLHPAAEGILLKNGDIIETPDRALAQIETADGSLVAFAGGTRAMLMAQPGAGASLEIFVLTGAVKVTAAGPVKMATATATASATRSTFVVETSPELVSLFVETGQVALDATAGDASKLRDGEFWSRRPGQKGATAGRPAPAFIAALPKPFLDPLPRRWQAVGGRQVPLKSGRDFSYKEVEPWLTSTPAVRRVLVARWQAKAADPAFRASLVANLKQFPEWTPILYPPAKDPGRESRWP
jgi:hypothetical protein